MKKLTKTEAELKKSVAYKKACSYSNFHYIKVKLDLDPSKKKNDLYSIDHRSYKFSFSKGHQQASQSRGAPNILFLEFERIYPQ